VAGTIKRPPAWMENVGLAWFFRLLQNPRRMWRRYLIYNFKFIFMAIRLTFLGKPEGQQEQDEN
ncbi:MAG: WecB/TagA/CpsF family glycosyltransferase, partial [Gammaproteobacteria bacterium]|nr:WecB/TagA/CpsF family glycosyltransferase [Gammaproteobacteria bacterium]